MKSATSLVAKQYRLQEWAAQIRECHNRPAGMKVSEWCELHGITKDSYYYRLKKVREACCKWYTIFQRFRQLKIPKNGI